MFLVASIYLIIGAFIAEVAVKSNPRTIGFLEYVVATALWPLVLLMIARKILSN